MRIWPLFNFDTFKNEYKKHFRKNSVFLKNQKGGITKVVFFTVISILTLAAITYCLFRKELISEDFFFLSIVALLGWLFALITNLIHTKQNREDNIIIQNNEIIKRLEIDAFKEISKTIENTATVLAKKETCYFHICRQVEETDLTTVVSLSSLLKTLEDTYNKMSQATMGLPELWKKINLSVKTYEIILRKLNELLLALENEFQTSIVLTHGLEKYFSTLKTKNNLTINDISALKEKCENIEKKINKIGLLLTGYHVAATNQILGPVFGCKLPSKEI